MKGKHSPGPWHRNIPPATKYVTIYRGRNTHVCDVIPSRGISPEEAEANLTMIAAGPTLVQALLDCITDNGSCAMSRHAVGDAIRRLEAINEIARAAIRVAETGRAE